MSVTEPAALPPYIAAAELPEFPVAMRGYDKQRVDAFITEMRRQLMDERRRADDSGRRIAQLQHEVNSARNQQPSWEHLGPVAAQVLEQAGQSARLVEEAARGRGEAIVQDAEVRAGEIVRDAEERATALETEAQHSLAEASGERDRIVAEASAEAEQLRTQAEEDAQRALEQTRDVAERIRERVRHEQMTMQAETERLRGARDRMLEYLSRIHADLVELLAEASASPMNEPVAEPARVAETSYLGEEDAKEEEGVETVTHPVLYGDEPTAEESEEELSASASADGGQEHQA